ncbi:S8 family serine peptidase [Candidatus Poribacteria bacterium]|nr:S8 family serine peptidase [Candidatus Poribacteria bacterium]
MSVNKFITFIIILLLFLISTDTFSLDSNSLHVGKLFKPPPDFPDYIPGEILVSFKPGVTEDIKHSIHNQKGIKDYIVSYSGRFQRVFFDKNLDVEEMVDLYLKSPYVLYAEPNYTAYAYFTPNDPFYEFQWHFHSPDQGGVNLEKAWDVSTGEGIIVAVVDTGVAYEDFDGYLQAPDLANTSFVEGYDFVDDDFHPNDGNGHGTHVAGTIAQNTNNRRGTAGGAFNCLIMPIRVLDDDGFGMYSSIIDGLDYAVENGAKVINMSLGSGQPSKVLEESLINAHESGVILVAAAGNEFFAGSPTSYPAAYDSYAITVGAVRLDGQRAPYSNVGDYIDISAPGGDLSVDQNEDEYADGVLQQAFMMDPADFQYWFFQGTSMAAPHISAAAAMLLANGITGVHDVTQALLFSARDMGKPGWDEEYGWGILDVWAALNYEYQTIHDIGITSVKASREIISGETGTIIVTVRNHGTTPENVEVTVKDSKGNEISPPQDGILQLASSHDFTFQWDTTGVSLGESKITINLHQLPGEANLADNSKTIILTVVSEESRTMFVKDIKIETFKGFIAWSAVAEVTVVSGDGHPVEGAWVFGWWSGPIGWPDFDFTNVDGVAVFNSGPIFGEGEVDFTIHSISKQGWRFNADMIVPEEPDEESTSVNVSEKQSTYWSKLKSNYIGAKPGDTRSFQNYPNPFNPDTWIPYQLAESSNMLIEIYNSSGELIRILDLGFKPAGFYINKNSSAHWDGKNKYGEKVSSGLYFYVVKAEDYMSTHKMILSE